LNLQDQIVDELASKMQSEIDFQILSDMLVELGWVKIFVRYSPPQRSWDKVKQWAEDNCQGNHQEHNGIWVFEDQKDANWFALKWL